MTPEHIMWAATGLNLTAFALNLYQAARADKRARDRFRDALIEKQERVSELREEVARLQGTGFVFHWSKDNLDDQLFWSIVKWIEDNDEDGQIEWGGSSAHPHSGMFRFMPLGNTIWVSTNNKTKATLFKLTFGGDL